MDGPLAKERFCLLLGNSGQFPTALCAVNGTPPMTERVCRHFQRQCYAHCIDLHKSAIECSLEHSLLIYILFWLYHPFSATTCDLSEQNSQKSTTYGGPLGGVIGGG